MGESTKRNFLETLTCPNCKSKRIYKDVRVFANDPARVHEMQASLELPAGAEWLFKHADFLTCADCNYRRAPKYFVATVSNEEYLEKKVCPYCGSTNISSSWLSHPTLDGAMTRSGDDIWQKTGCVDCGETHDAIYTLSGYKK
jgi:phage FluMu protein Com